MNCPKCRSAHALTMAPVYRFRRRVGLWRVGGAERKEVGYWAKCVNCGADYVVTEDGSSLLNIGQAPAPAPAPAAPARRSEAVPRAAHLPDEDMKEAPEWK